MVFVFDLRAVGDRKTNLAKAADNLLGDLRQRMQFAQRPAPAWQCGIGRFLGQRALELKFAAAVSKSGFQLGLGGVDRFSSSRFFFLRKRAKLLQQSGEFAVGPEVTDASLFEACEIRCLAQFGQPGFFQWFNLLEESGHKSWSVW